MLIDFHPEREPDPAELLAVWRAADQLPEPQRTYIKVLILTLAREDEVARHALGRARRRPVAAPSRAAQGQARLRHTAADPGVELIEALPRVSAESRLSPAAAVVRSATFSGSRPKLDRLSGVDGLAAARPEATGSSWIEEEFGARGHACCLGHSLGDRLAKTYARGAGYRRKKAALQAWADYVTGAAQRGKVVRSRRALRILRARLG